MVLDSIYIHNHFQKNTWTVQYICCLVHQNVPHVGRKKKQLHVDLCAQPDSVIRLVFTHQHMLHLMVI